MQLNRVFAQSSWAFFYMNDKLENIKNIPLGKGPLGIALTKDDKFLLVADWYEHKVRVINTNTLNKNNKILRFNICQST